MRLGPGRGRAQLPWPIAAVAMMAAAAPAPRSVFDDISPRPHTPSADAPPTTRVTIPLQPTTVPSAPAQGPADAMNPLAAPLTRHPQAPRVLRRHARRGTIGRAQLVHHAAIDPSGTAMR